MESEYDKSAGAIIWIIIIIIDIGVLRAFCNYCVCCDTMVAGTSSCSTRYHRKLSTYLIKIVIIVEHTQFSQQHI